MSASDVRFIVVTLVLTFLFVGDPDVWDGLRHLAMQSLQEKP